MLLRSARVFGTAVAVGAVLLLSACGQQTPAPAPMPPDLSSPGELVQPPIVYDDSSTTSAEPEPSTPDAPAPPSAKPTTKTPPKTTAEQPPPVTEFYAATYVDGTNRKLVQRPTEFIPPNVTGQYASETKLMNLKWSSWGENGGIATGDAYVTGGGAPPETVHGVEIILDNPQMRNGKMQYTHYLITWPQYPPDEGELNTM